MALYSRSSLAESLQKFSKRKWPEPESWFIAFGHMLPHNSELHELLSPSISIYWIIHFCTPRFKLIFKFSSHVGIVFLIMSTMFHWFTKFQGGGRSVKHSNKCLCWTGIEKIQWKNHSWRLTSVLVTSCEPGRIQVTCSAQGEMPHKQVVGEESI